MKSLQILLFCLLSVSQVAFAQTAPISPDCNSNNIPDNCDLDPLSDPVGCGANLVEGIGVSAQDLCHNAEEVTAGSYYDGTTIGATNSVNDENLCSGSDDNRDVWYKYIPTVDGNLQLSFSETRNLNQNVDPVVAIYREFPDVSTCSQASGTLLTCADNNNCGFDNTNLITPVTAGTTYYIRIADDFFDSPGNFRMYVLQSNEQFCPVQSPTESDCTENGIPDSCDIAEGVASDCNFNGRPDSCDLSLLDGTEVDIGDGETAIADLDRNNNGLLDQCEDCNRNFVNDICEIDEDESFWTLFSDSELSLTQCSTLCDGNCGTASDCQAGEGEAGYLIPDMCESDCNANNIPDSCDLRDDPALDCNQNDVPDSCDLASPLVASRRDTPTNAGGLFGVTCGDSLGLIYHYTDPESGVESVGRRRVGDYGSNQLIKDLAVSEGDSNQILGFECKQRFLGLGEFEATTEEEESSDAESVEVEFAEECAEQSLFDVDTNTAALTTIGTTESSLCTGFTGTTPGVTSSLYSIGNNLFAELDPLSAGTIGTGSATNGHDMATTPEDYAGPTVAENPQSGDVWSLRIDTDFETSCPIGKLQLHDTSAGTLGDVIGIGTITDADFDESGRCRFLLAISFGKDSLENVSFYGITRAGFGGIDGVEEGAATGLGYDLVRLVPIELEDEPVGDISLFRFEMRTIKELVTSHIGLGSNLAPASQDCDSNATPDECQADCDMDGIPDSCETDGDGDGTVDDCDSCPTDSEKIEPGQCGCNVSDQDSDNDGTPDCLDECPVDPILTEEPCLPPADTCESQCEENGNPLECQQDLDNDGLVDACELCPNDPNKIAPGACGCNVADTDSDGDGTPDCNDACPEDPRLSEGQCELGCEAVELVETQFRLDGAALALSKRIKRAAKILRLVTGKSKLANQAAQQGEELFMESWQLAWTLPSVNLTCSNTQLCVTSDNRPVINQYNANAQAMRDLALLLVRRILNNSDKPRVRRKAKRLRAESKQLYELMLQASATVPLERSICSE